MMGGLLLLLLVVLLLLLLVLLLLFALVLLTLLRRRRGRATVTLAATANAAAAAAAVRLRVRAVGATVGRRRSLTTFVAVVFCGSASGFEVYAKHEMSWFKHNRPMSDWNKFVGARSSNMVDICCSLHDLPAISRIVSAGAPDAFRASSIWLRRFCSWSSCCCTRKRARRSFLKRFWYRTARTGTGQMRLGQHIINNCVRRERYAASTASEPNSNWKFLIKSNIPPKGRSPTLGSGVLVQ